MMRTNCGFAAANGVFEMETKTERPAQNSSSLLRSRKLLVIFLV